jgi:predicted MFS family arabinose efflux permease
MSSTTTPVDAPQEASSDSLGRPAYRNYVLLILFLAYVANIMDRAVLSVLLHPIKLEFGASDTQLGLLGGLAFAVFYSTLGIPIAALADRSSRRNVLAVAIATWSVMTVLCGKASNFTTLLLARIGTAVGEAGGSPPSHSLISDYFPLSTRATALSIFALGVPLGNILGNYIGGVVSDSHGWRSAFMVVGAPGLVVAALVFFTVREPPRGFAERRPAAPGSASARADAPRLVEAFRFLYTCKSFLHLCLAAALHSVAYYGGSTFNATFLVRSHEMTTSEAGKVLAALAVVGALGTFLGGYLADKLGVRTNDRRWYMWLPGYATLFMVPFQFGAYLAPSLWVAMPSFAIMIFLATMFFGPSYATTQALAPVRMRTLAASLLLFMQTLIGLGLGPFFAGLISDHLAPSLGRHSLAYGLVIVGLVNVWAAAHYFWGGRTIRADLERTAAS